MELSTIRKIKGVNKKSKRLGRGFGSGKGGHTVGRGTKGQKARRGHKFTVGFEGGQVPLYKRLPQLGGFRNRSSKDIISVALSNLNRFKDGDTVEPKTLVSVGLIRRVPRHGVKLLNNGILEKKLVLKGFLFSKSAQTAIEKVGAKINE